MSDYERLARQALDTRYKLADGTELRSGVTVMRDDLTNLAWAVIELEKRNKSLRLVMADTWNFEERDELRAKVSPAPPEVSP